MLRIRLRRTGRRKAPSYRVVVAHSRDPRDGDFVEIVGHYNPAASPKVLELKEERVRHWLAVGATPSETVHRLLHSRGLIEKPPRTRGTVAAAAEPADDADATDADAGATDADAGATADDAGATDDDAGATDDDAGATDADADATDDGEA